MISKKQETTRDKVSIISVDDLVPKDHMVRKLDKAMDFTFIYDLVKDLYSDSIGRPSVDPVVLFKILFIQYLFGIRSMRQTIEEIKVNMAYRWFLGFEFQDEVPHHSTFGKNYVRRFKDTPIFEEIFKHILSQAIHLGYVKLDTVFIDSTHIKANANKHKRIKINVEEEYSKIEKQLQEEINQIRLEEGKKAFEYEETVTKEITQSKTDEESGMFVKGEKERSFAYSVQTASDANGFVVGSTVVAGNVHDAKSFHPFYEEHLKTKDIKTIVADVGYKTPLVAKVIQEDHKELITAYTRPKGPKGNIKKTEFEYHKEEDCYTCPAGVILSYRTTNRNGYREYRSDKASCKNCPYKSQCTISSSKTLTRHIHQNHTDRLEEIRLDPVSQALYKLRKETIERVFADTKYKQNLGITPLKGIKKNQMRTVLIFACHNLKKMATWMHRKKITHQMLVICSIIFYPRRKFKFI
jgi:transposase